MLLLRFTWQRAARVENTANDLSPKHQPVLFLKIRSGPIGLGADVAKDRLLEPLSADVPSVNVLGVLVAQSTKLRTSHQADEPYPRAALAKLKAIARSRPGPR